MVYRWDHLVMQSEQYRWETFYRCLLNLDEVPPKSSFERMSLSLQRKIVIIKSRSFSTTKLLTIIRAHTTQECPSTWLSIILIHITIVGNVITFTWIKRKRLCLMASWLLDQTYRILFWPMLYWTLLYRLDERSGKYSDLPDPPI